MEDSSAKPMTHYSELPDGYNDLEYSKRPVLTTADLNVTDAKFGDIVNCGNYRFGDAFIVGKDSILIPNPDNSQSGHLSIPYEITQYLTDAVGKYEGEEVFDIALRYDDVFLTDWFGTPPEEFKQFKFQWTIAVGTLRITFPTKITGDFNPPCMKHRVKPHTLKDVMKYYKGTLLRRCRVTLKYNIDAENFPRFAAKYSNKAEIDKQIAELEAESAANPPSAPPITMAFGGLPNIHSVLVPKQSKSASSDNVTGLVTGASDSPATAGSTSVGAGAAPSSFPPTAFGASASSSLGASADPPASAGFGLLSTGFGTSFGNTTAATVAAAPPAPPAPPAPVFGFGVVPSIHSVLAPQPLVTAVADPPVTTGFGAPHATSASAAAAPASTGFGLPSTGFGLSGAGTAGAASSVIPSAPSAFGGFGAFGTSSQPTVGAGVPMMQPPVDFQLMMKRTQLIASIKYEDPVIPASFSRYNRNFGLNTQTRYGTVVMEGPRADLDELLACLSEFYESFQYTTDVADIETKA